MPNRILKKNSKKGWKSSFRILTRWLALLHHYMMKFPDFSYKIFQCRFAKQASLPYHWKKNSAYPWHKLCVEGYKWVLVQVFPQFFPDLFACPSYICQRRIMIPLITLEGDILLEILNGFRRVLKDFRWFIRHHSSVVESAELEKLSNP